MLQEPLCENAFEYSLAIEFIYLFRSIIESEIRSALPPEVLIFGFSSE